MEFRHLRYFLAVAEELHFARAAERLHIEQSPLSRAIRELEEELGAQLFVRTSRSTRLTLAGKLLMENAPRVLLALDQARESVKAAANGFHGRLRVALSDGITPSRLPALLARCREEDPEIEIRLFEVPLAQQLSGLRDDLYDAGFSMADEVGDGIIIEPAWEDELMVAMPARHELLAHRRVPLDEVLQHPLVLGDPADLAKKGRRGVRAIGPMLEQNFTDSGIELVKLDAGERAAFASKSEQVHDWFRKDTSSVGKAMLDKIKAAT